MEFANKVKLAREHLKISQEKMAQLLGVSFSTVNRWEQGKSLPSYAVSKRFSALCKEHNIEIDE